MDETPIPPASAFDGRTAKTTVTSFRIVEALDRRESARLTDLADELGLAKGTVHKHLSALREVNYVVKDGEEYRLSVRFLGLGTSARLNLDLYEIAYDPLEKLADATGEVASVMVPEHGYGVYVLRVSNEGRPDVDIREGESVPLTATAGGKAILSYTPEERRERIIEQHGLPEMTDATITDRQALDEELRRIRDRRLANDTGEYRSDQHCVANPIVDADDVAIGAVTVSGPADRMAEKSIKADFASLVGSTTASIESRL
ncbi:IclR family transcriptional regulator [Halosimplex aquaticum]